MAGNQAATRYVMLVAALGAWFAGDVSPRSGRPRVMVVVREVGY